MTLTLVLNESNSFQPGSNIKQFDIDPTMPNIQLVRALFLYYNILGLIYRAPRSTAFELSCQKHRQTAKKTYTHAHARARARAHTHTQTHQGLSCRTCEDYHISLLMRGLGLPIDGSISTFVPYN